VIDLSSPDLRRNPFPIYRQLREQAPILHDPRSDSWLLFDYDSVKLALTDHDRFSSDMRHAGRGSPEWIIFRDPPQQTRLRSLISRAFTPRAIAELEPRIRALSTELLDDVAERGEMDLVGQYATPLPMMVIAGMIGIPTEEWPRFRNWSDGILKLSHTISAGEAANAAIMEYAAVKTELSVFVLSIIEERRASPQDDLITRLVQAEVDGERLTECEIMGFVELLLVAGQETTSNLISNAILCLSEHPDQCAALQAQPELWPAAIEEVLRYRSAVQWLFRATTCDVPMHGQVIPAGKLVLPIVGSANRDPRIFADPERFDITRNPNPHIAFGHGIHFCLGAPLARLEARVALPDLIARLKELEIAGNEPWTPRDALHVHGPARLPVRFAPGKALSAGALTV
jgi:cytochrome P450